MDISSPDGRDDIKGGKTIVGYIGAYMEKYHTDWDAIMRMPWCRVVLLMIDTPHIDFKEKSKKAQTPRTAEEEAALIDTYFK